MQSTSGSLMSIASCCRRRSLMAFTPRPEARSVGGTCLITFGSIPKNFGRLSGRGDVRPVALSCRRSKYLSRGQHSARSGYPIYLTACHKSSERGCVNLTSHLQLSPPCSRRRMGEGPISEKIPEEKSILRTSCATNREPPPPGGHWATVCKSRKEWAGITRVARVECLSFASPTEFYSIVVYDGSAVA
jgi:hypothetical protein